MNYFALAIKVSLSCIIYYFYLSSPYILFTYSRTFSMNYDFYAIYFYLYVQSFYKLTQTYYKFFTFTRNSLIWIS